MEAKRAAAATAAPGRRPSRSHPVLPPENPVEKIVEKIFDPNPRNGGVVIRDPTTRGAKYFISHEPDRCPNIEVRWVDLDGKAKEPCIDCDGFPCEGCDVSGDFRALARAVVGAILAGRGVRDLGQDTVISSWGRIRQTTKREADGQGPEGEDARPGRPAQPRTPAPQVDLASPIRTLGFARHVILPYGGDDQPACVGTLTIAQEGAGHVVKVVSTTGAVLKQMTFADAWWILQNVTIDRDHRTLHVTWGG